MVKARSENFCQLESHDLVVSLPRSSVEIDLEALLLAKPSGTSARESRAAKAFHE